ncbi:hypothetical protein MLD38_038298 [Melastoma candidum]|uniref:Uncharacterized protein n=1 Tax=Melastoma candidum TaxID=119954 RepID=A0ACB9KYG4_9MYRT|nr:hypothetical protein MLD38_038298 [Melastoma candidum]
MSGFFSTDYSSSLNHSRSSASLFFPDVDLVSCLSDIGNQFAFQDFPTFPHVNGFTVPPAFPEDVSAPLISPADKQNKPPRLFANPEILVAHSESGSWQCSGPMPYLRQGEKQFLGKGKRKRGKEEEGERDEQHRGKEVIHVRAKRGQATDSHSLAERVRRGKINERLKCLKEIVPGCYKTTGMAVMLDEIINYVQSLQNQVEFLSMKLAAASTYYDFNSEAGEGEPKHLGKNGKGKGQVRARLEEESSCQTWWTS